MRIQTGDPDGTFECLTVIGYLRPGVSLKEATEILLPAEDAARILWRQESKNGWTVPPAYRVLETLPTAMVVECEEPPHAVLSLQAVAKPLPEGASSWL